MKIEITGKLSRILCFYIEQIFFNECSMSIFLLQPPEDFDYYNNYLAQPVIRKAIHVGNLTYNDGRAVEMAIINDIMDTVKPWVELILDNYKVQKFH